MRAAICFVSLAAIALASPADARDQRVVTTRSGHPEILLLGRDIVDARGQISYVCERLGWKPAAAKAIETLTCDVPTTDTVSVLLNSSSPELGKGRSPSATSSLSTSMMSFSNWTKVPIRRIVKFEFDPAPRGVVVRARAERMVPASGNSSRYEHQPIADSATFNGLLNVIALAGDATFAPGTTFAKVGYLGFRSDRFAEVELQGRERTAIQIGAIEAGSPAETAGLKTGDFILAMNGRDFENYRGVAKFLSALKPGTPVALLVERGGQRMEFSATATTPPPLATEP